MGNKLLMPGMSFGHVSSVALEDLKRGLLSVNDERECVLLIAEILKKGDFIVKNLLIDLMNQTKDEPYSIFVFDCFVQFVHMMI